MVFLCETKASKERCRLVVKSCNMEEWYCIEAENSDGGLLLMWRQEIQVSILYSSKYNIIARIEHQVFYKPWIIICAYGPPYAYLKDGFWSGITRIIDQLNEPWLMLGDLNEIMHEKDEGR